MATEPSIRHVEAVIGYTFKGTHYLIQALTAAAVDAKNYDGNRKMAQLGESLIGTVIFDNTLTTNATREQANVRLSRAGSKDHRVAVAKRSGIDGCIRYCPRQSGELPSPMVLSRTVSAIVGASWLDSGKDINVVAQVIERLGVVPHEQPCIDPTILVLEQIETPSTDTVGSQTWYGDAATPITTYLQPTTEITSDAAVLLVGATLNGEQSPRIPPSMEQNDPSQNPIIQFGILDHADETFFGETQGIIPYVEVATNNRNQSRASPSTLLDGQIVDTEDQNRDSMSLISLESTSVGHATANTERFQILGETISKSEYHLHNTHIGQQEANQRLTNRSLSTSGSITADFGIDQFRNDGGEWPLRTRVMPITRTEPTESPAKRRKTSNRQRSSGGDVSLQDPLRPNNSEILLDQLIAHERRKFESLGHHDSSVFLLSQDRMSELGMDRHRSILKHFFFAVASSQSMVTLRDILRACRDRTAEDLSEPTQGLSNAKRLEFIEHLDGNLAYFNLLRRCHILKLFIDNFDSSRQPHGGFVVETQQSLSSTTRKKSGNPSNIAHAEMTKSMIQEIYPNLRQDTTEYQSKYRSVSDLRKLGKRLHFLTTTFGYGMIGLLPSAPGSDLCISDSMIQMLPEDIFSQFVRILEQYQGSILREFSDAVQPIVKHIFHGTIYRFNPLPIENAQLQEILEQPKGSAKLLELLQPKLN